VLGIDHRGLLSILKAGDHTALHKGFGSYPLRTLAPIAAVAGLLALGAMRVFRNDPDPPPTSHGESAAPRSHPALAG
jgi:hypothetical protein